MLLDFMGRPIPLSGPDSTKDHRTKEQHRFDMRFRQAMEAGGNNEFPPELIRKIKAQIARRDMENDIRKLQEENAPTRLDDISANVLEDSNNRKKNRIHVH